MRAPAHLERTDTHIRFAYPLPATPWSVNQQNSSHWRTHHPKKVAFRKGARKYAQLARIGPLQGRWSVQITIPFARGARRDPHNYVSTVVKATVDGLTKGGVWPDDSPEHVTVLEPILDIVPDRRRHWLSIELTRVDGPPQS